MSPMWLSPMSASSGGRVLTPIGMKLSSVCDTPPCQEKNQLLPSVVTPCERMSASWYLKVSVPTRFQVVVHAAFAAGAASASIVAAMSSDLRIRWENGWDRSDLAAPA